MKLLDVCELIVDCPHTTAKDEGEGYALIRTPNIGKGRLVLDGVHRVSREVYESRISRATPQENDLILAREAPVGNVAKITNGQVVCLGQRTVLIRPNKEIVSPDFLTYYLLSPEQQHKLTSSSNGATVAHLNMNKIRSLSIDLPSLPIQNKIAEILSAYDDMIDTCKQQIALLEEAAQRLYREWVSNSECVPTLLNQIIKFQSGYAFKSSSFEAIGKYAIVTIKNVKDGTFDDSKFSYINEVSSKVPSHCCLHNGDIVLSLTGDVARCCFIIGGNNLLNQRVARIKTAYPNFSYLFLRSPETRSKLCNIANGAAQQNLSPIRAEHEQFNLPSVKQIEKIEALTEPYLEKVKVLNLMISHLKKSKTMLLPRLISGQIEITA